MTDQGLFAFAEFTDWEQAAEDEVLVADVVFNLPLQQPYTYLVPEGLRDVIRPGKRVRAPLGRGNRETVGYCVAVRRPDVDFSQTGIRKLKSISELLDTEPLLDEAMLQLTRWIGERYLCGWGQVLDSVIPAGVRKKSGTRQLNLFQLSKTADEIISRSRLSRQQTAVVRVLRDAGRSLSAVEICQRADCNPGSVTSLSRKGILAAERSRTDVCGEDISVSIRQPDLILNHQQEEALAGILRPIRESRHETILLHGVTGSGKTEVYIRAIREIVSYGRQAIVLVPEISLTPQTIRRFRSRFQKVAVLHSHMTDSERHWQWQQIASGEVQVIVGARSAVFAPTPHLGIIIIDEEHEPSFKQDSTPRYHAREVARKRCIDARVPLILGSATPTLESWLRAVRSHDQLVSMPSRVEDRPLPPVVIVDTRTDPRIQRGSSLGTALHQAIGRTLRDDGQVILFLNLRGYSPTVWCRGCGEGVKCPNCDVTLTWHRDRQVIVCHSCEYTASPPAVCPKCQSPSIRYLGAGTQKLDEEVTALFPAAGVIRMDSDSMQRPGSHDEALERFRTGQAKILLGTQMIAKGLDFPNVTLVGVIDADTMLRQPDLRAAERTFQLIAQVAGRTGRGDRGGRVLVQTATPQDPAIRFAARHDYIGFARHELAERYDLQAPPFSTTVRVIFRGPDEGRTRRMAQSVAEKLRASGTEATRGVRILGAAPAPVTRLRGLWRFHLQMAGSSFEMVRDRWLSVAGSLELPENVEMAVDVDPINMR